MEITKDSADTETYKSRKIGVDASSLDYHSMPLSYNDPRNFRSYKNRHGNNGAVKPSDKLNNIDLDRIHFRICYTDSDADRVTKFFGDDINYYLGLFLISNTEDDNPIIDTDTEQLNNFLEWLSKNIYGMDTSELTDDLAGYVSSISENFRNMKYITYDDNPNIADIQMYISNLNTLLNKLDCLDSSVRSFEQTSTNFALGVVYDNLTAYMKQNIDSIMNVSSMIDMIDNNKKNLFAPAVFAELLIFLETIDATGKHKDKIKETLESFSDSYKECGTFGNPDNPNHTLQYVYNSLGGKKELFPVKDTQTGQYLRLKADS
ncbi:MAG: hypothetical protein KAS90_00660 [Candidatus Aenigmarchaeota archaeon]|nr:hypothetical protein [Candidatus Aenigmarchaeota archaeon]